MRTTALILLASTFAVCGQTAQRKSDTPYTVTTKDANSQIWERTTYEQSPDGKQVPKVHRYTELATGLNYLKDGEWTASKEEITILPQGGAAATQGQHQVYFPGDIYQGQIELITPDGKHLKSRPLGLSYDDGRNTVLIAELKDSTGYLVGSNQIVYPDAFTDFKADLRYTYTKAGFEQDIILREQPPIPATFNMDPDQTHLQLLTEFFNTAKPKQQKRKGDTELIFGTMKMVRGKAFETPRTDKQKGLSVAKSWQKLEGRDFLVEELPVDQMAKELEALPEPAQQLSKNNSAIRNKLSSTRLLPPMRLAQATTNTVQLAKADFNQQKGFVLDYVTINSDSNTVVFQSDTTYLIGASLTVGNGSEDGSSVIFEGGAVIKFTTNATVGIYFDQYDAAYKTGPYRPVIFTSKDDNSVGDTISGSTGNPVIMTNVTYLPNVGNGGQPPNYLYFRYAGVALGMSDPSSASNCQFVKCNEAIQMSWGQLGLFNCLFSGCNVSIASDEDLQLTADNVTADNGEAFVSATEPGSYPYYHFINCLFTRYEASVVGLTVDGINDSSYEQSDASCYKSAGAGNYYLADNSPYRNIGSTNGNFTALRQKTTYAPVVYAQQILTNDLILSPTAQRDTDLPDIGYHYDPLDYAFGWIYASNATITVNAGTAIALFGTNYGIYGIGLAGNSQFISQGAANNLNRMVEYSAVQEQPNPNLFSPWYALLTDVFLTEGLGKVDCRFTDWAVMAYDAPHFQGSHTFPVSFRDCQFHGGQIYGEPATVNLTNCLLERVYSEIFCDFGITPVIRNNLVWRGTFNFYSSETNAVVKDNLFDCPVMEDWIEGSGNTYDGGHNAYVTNYDRLHPTYSSDVILSSSPNYLSGSLGNYYLPYGSSLVNAGSTTADQVGLFHFTTRTDQVKEGNSTVDIGYHYVATDGSGNPLDADGDGVPDYLEDRNGNGLVDGGENSWTNYNSANGLITGSGLKVFTPLK